VADYGTIGDFAPAEGLTEATDYGLTTTFSSYGTVQNIPGDLVPNVSPTVDYALTGTLQPDAGNPPPNAGQIWPRGATQL